MERYRDPAYVDFMTPPEHGAISSGLGVRCGARPWPRYRLDAMWRFLLAARRLVPVIFLSSLTGVLGNYPPACLCGERGEIAVATR